MGLVVLISVVTLTMLVLARSKSTVPDIASAANPGWIVSCNYSHSLPDDPIVFPGQVGVAHLHDFIGASTTNAFSTAESLRSGGTTCVVKGDTSSYWVPAVYQNGVRVLPTATSKDALFYYRRIAAPSGTVVRTIPDGLRMIVGNQRATSAAENEGIASGRIIFKCGPGSSTDLPAPPSVCSSGVMSISFKFPNCWNGTDLDSSDHLSHMSYPVGSRCPATHPVVLPRVESFFRYSVGTAPIGTITLASGPYYTAHQDFFAAWKPTALQFLVTKCINGNLDCEKNPVVPD